MIDTPLRGGPTLPDTSACKRKYRVRMVRVEEIIGIDRIRKRHLVEELTLGSDRGCGGNEPGVEVRITDVDKDNRGSGGHLFAAVGN